MARRFRRIRRWVCAVSLLTAAKEYPTSWSPPTAVKPGRSGARRRPRPVLVREWKVSLKLAPGKYRLMVVRPPRRPVAAARTVVEPAGYMRNVVEATNVSRHEATANEPLCDPSPRLAPRPRFGSHRRPARLSAAGRDGWPQARPGRRTAAVCEACHSADYITTQPPKEGKAFWQAEVQKMIKVYKAPIAESDAAIIVDYLAATY